MLWTVKRLANASWRRAYSAQPAPVNPHPGPIRNLRAYPFILPPDVALSHLSPFVSWLQHRKFVSSVLCWCFSRLGFSTFKPVRFQPIYFPSWILDVELQGQVATGSDNQQASACIDSVYIPGSDYKVLSSAALAPHLTCPADSVPFSEDLLRQHGLDIACIPYNISPFSILDIASLLSYAEATIEPNFRLIPSTLKANFFAAYPILIPLYLAQYEVETKSGKRLHTLFIEAYDPLVPDVWSESFAGNLMELAPLSQTLRSFHGLPAQSNRSVVNMLIPKRFVGTASFSLHPFGPSLRDYLEKAIDRPGAAATLAAASVHNLDKLAKDRRIREFTPEERDPVIKWLEYGSHIAWSEQVHKVLSETRNAGNRTVNGAQQNQQFAKENDGSFIDELQASRLKIKPQWALTREEREQKKKGLGAWSR